MKVAVILPAYNEALTIKSTILSFHSALPEAKIYVVDNNSTDNTYQIAADALASINMEANVIVERKQGKGNAVRRAFIEIDADVYLMSDADMTYPAEQAQLLLSPIIDGLADMTVGDRLSEGHYKRENKRSFHGFGNNLVRLLVNKLFKANLSDIMTGYRAFSKQFVKNYPILVDGFQIETDVTLHALDKRYRIMEIPIEYKDRPEGSFSKLNTMSDGAKVILTIANILRHYKPLFFFSILSLLCLFSGILAAIPVLDDWFTHRYIYHVPLAILASALELSALLFFSVGLILDSIVHNNKFNYELKILSNYSRIKK